MSGLPPQGFFLPGISANISSAKINERKECTPSFAYNKGLPLEYYSINEFSHSFFIDFANTPFTYLNIGGTFNISTTNINDINSSVDTNVFISNVPIGTMFIINGPKKIRNGYNVKLYINDYDMNIPSRDTVLNYLIVLNKTNIARKVLS